MVYLRRKGTRPSRRKGPVKQRKGPATPGGTQNAAVLQATALPLAGPLRLVRRYAALLLPIVP